MGDRTGPGFGVEFESLGRLVLGDEDAIEADIANNDAVGEVADIEGDAPLEAALALDAEGDPGASPRGQFDAGLSGGHGQLWWAGDSDDGEGAAEGGHADQAPAGNDRRPLEVEREGEPASGIGRSVEEEGHAIHAGTDDPGRRGVAGGQIAQGDLDLLLHALGAEGGDLDRNRRAWGEVGIFRIDRQAEVWARFPDREPVAKGLALPSAHVAQPDQVVAIGRRSEGEARVLAIHRPAIIVPVVEFDLRHAVGRQDGLRGVDRDLVDRGVDGVRFRGSVEEADALPTDVLEEDVLIGPLGEDLDLQ